MLWSVYYALSEPSLAAIRAATTTVVDPDRFSIVTELLEGGEEGVSQLALTVDAGSLSGALSVAAGCWAELQAEADVPRAAAHLTYVVGPMDGPAPFHETLLARAAQTLAGGEPSYALVAAVSAYEVYERQVVKDLATRHMPADLADDVWTVYKESHRKAQQQFLEKLLGNKMEDAGKPWLTYKESLRSRQAIVHRGAFVEHDAAVDALRAVRDLIAWIEGIAQSRP